MKKQIITTHPQGFIRINISTDGCGQEPYFSITADICADTTFRDSKIHACGCLHEDILAVRPDLKPFVDLHLSTLDGIPMHAVENGFYWLCKAAGIPQKHEPEQSPEKCLEYFANHIRADIGHAKELIEVFQLCFDKFGKTKTKESWILHCENMKPRWKQEAAQALKQLEEIK